MPLKTTPKYASTRALDPPSSRSGKPYGATYGRPLEKELDNQGRGTSARPTLRRPTLSYHWHPHPCTSAPFASLAPRRQFRGAILRRNTIAAPAAMSRQPLKVAIILCPALAKDRTEPEIVCDGSRYGKVDKVGWSIGVHVISRKFCTSVELQHSLLQLPYKVNLKDGQRLL